MKFDDMKVGQKVRCVYFGSSFLDKTATITEAPKTPYGQIVVKWDDGSPNDTRWSYPSSFEPVPETPPVKVEPPKVVVKNNICCVCGYPDEWIAHEENIPACRACSPKISLGSFANSLEDLQKEEKRAPTGNGFPKSHENRIAAVKDEFTKLQDRTQYQPGDRIRIRIKNEKDIWATVLLTRDPNDVLLFLDEHYKGEEVASWATSDIERKEIIRKLGLKPEHKRCLWWGEFSNLYDKGTSSISVLHKQAATKAAPTDRSKLNHGDRIKIRIKGKPAVWATVIDHKSILGTTLHLDKPYNDEITHSWMTKEDGRHDLIKKLGLDPKNSNCLFWGVETGNKSLNESDVEVLKVVDSSIAVYDKDIGVVDPSPPEDPYAHTTIAERPLKVGDVVKYVAEEPVVGDNPALVKNQTYRIRALEPHRGSFKVFLEGFEGEDVWWKPLRFEFVREKYELKPGDIVRYVDADGSLKKDRLYRVSSCEKDGTFAHDTKVRFNGMDGSFWYAYRFQLFKTVEDAPVKYPVGDRIQLKLANKTGWGTIIGTVFDGEIEKPIASMDTESSFGDGAAQDYQAHGVDFTSTIKNLGLNAKEPKCWKALPEEVLQVVSKGSPEQEELPIKSDDVVVKQPEPAVGEVKFETIKLDADPSTKPALTFNSNGGDLIFSGGINTIPLIIKFDANEWKIESDAPIRIGKETAPVNPENTGVDYAKDNLIDRTEKIINKDGTIKSEIWDGLNLFSKEQSLNGFDKGFIEELQKELQKQTKEEPAKEKSFGSMVKEDAIDAGYRVVANQLTKGIKAGLLKLMKDKGADNNKIALLQEILETEMGNALIAMILGMSLTYIPTFSEDKRAKKLAGEFRIGGLTTTGNVLMDMVWQYIKNLPPAEKVRVDTSEVRIAEEPEEEIEDEKENSARSN